mgnify:CR=1 FL=1
MIRIREAIVVEGRYDRARMQVVVEALIVETEGFRIFRDKEKLSLLKRLAESQGLIVLTDSDAAGFLIRDRLSGAVPPAQVKHAYIPQIPGRERRKTVASKEGLLGVEGMDGSVLIEALRRAGATMEGESPNTAPPFLTKSRLFEDGLSGAVGSRERRECFLAYWGLPRYLSANRLVEVINATMTEAEYRKALAVCASPGTGKAAEKVGDTC